MELQFHKSLIPCAQTLAREVQNQELTQEVRLTDGMPDIGRVLASWGQLLIRSKEWRSGSVGVSGGVMAWVLYMPEDGQIPQSVAAWLPFQMKWDIGDSPRDGNIHVIPLLRGIDARSVSARKLMVRAGIGVQAEATVPAEVEYYTPSEDVQDVNILKNTYPLQIPAEAGEKVFSLEEALSLPDAAPQVDKIIRYELHPVISEEKVVSDKLVLRGTANLHVLYLDPQGKLNSWDFQIPFSQFAQLDKEYDADATASLSLVPTSLELEQGEEEQLNFKAGLIGQYMIYSGHTVTLAEDAYSNLREVTPQFEMFSAPARLDSSLQTETVEQNVQTQVVRPVDVSFTVEHPRLYREDGGIAGEMAGMFQLLGYDENGELSADAIHWEQSFAVPAGEDTRVEASVAAMAKPNASYMGDSATLRGELSREVAAFWDQGMPMMIGLELGEAKEPNPERPSVILRRAGQESLWELAKSAGSTVEAIQKVNNLQSEPQENQMLLIPVM